MKEGRLWTRNEVILAMALYRDAGRLLGRENERVQELARLLGRTEGSIATKLANVRAVERKGQGGLSHASDVDRKVWAEFQGRDLELQAEAERIRAATYKEDPPLNEEQIRADERRILEGKVESTERFSRTRRRQQTDAFRRIVLRNYGSSCSFCGLDVSKLLDAAHIRPWSVDLQGRLDPSNAICLCVLHHRAFDQGLLTLSQDLKVTTSVKLNRSTNPFVKSTLLVLDGVAMRLPNRSEPKASAVDYHRQYVFLT
jgi:hypothetical protein